MASRDQQKRATRRKIKSTASRLFAAHGVAVIPTSRIASAAGLSHGTLFVHFPTRADLLVEISRDFASALTDRLHALSQEDAPLTRVLGEHLSCIADQEDLYCRFLAEAALLPAGSKAAWVGLQSAVARHITPAYARGVESRQLRSFPGHWFFNTWIGLVHHYLANRELFAPRGSVIETQGEMLVDHYMALLQI